MYLGWYDPDKKTPSRAKAAEALRRYLEKFGRPAESCLTSPQDAAELLADEQAPDMTIKGVGYIPRYVFYVGQEDC